MNARRSLICITLLSLDRPGRHIDERRGMHMRDLRAFMGELKKKEQLVRVKKPVSLKHEIGDICRAVNEEAGPALLFEDIIESPGASVLCNIVGTPERVALALNTTRQDTVRHYLERSKNPIEPL